jgi:sortase A
VKKGEKKIRKSNLSTVLFVIGALFLAAALTFTVIRTVSEVTARKKAPTILSKMESLMPQIKSGGFDNRADTSHAMLEVDGESFIGILELPTYGTKLPVGSKWAVSELKAYPCRYDGSLYEGNLTVGGKVTAGQFDFMDKVTKYDAVFFTDVTGKRYSLEVTDVRVTETMDVEEWQKDCDLVLFSSTGREEYTVVKACFG